jgi:hypothetical protein
MAREGGNIRETGSQETCPWALAEPNSSRREWLGLRGSSYLSPLLFLKRAFFVLGYKRKSRPEAKDTGVELQELR